MLASTHFYLIPFLSQEATSANTHVSFMAELLSRIRSLTSKITQVCQDICGIKLRWLLVTQSKREPDDITANTLTNQNDCKDTWIQTEASLGLWTYMEVVLRMETTTLT